MTGTEVIAKIENRLTWFPERVSGNEVNATVADDLRGLAVSDRPSLLDALRQYMSLRIPPAQRSPKDAVREARVWLALDVAERLGLNELKPDIEALSEAVRNGEALDRIDEKTVVRYLQRMK